MYILQYLVKNAPRNFARLKDALCTLGRALERSGDDAGAADYFARAIELQAPAEVPPAGGRLLVCPPAALAANHRGGDGGAVLFFPPCMQTPDWVLANWFGGALCRVAQQRLDAARAAPPAPAVALLASVLQGTVRFLPGTPTLLAAQFLRACGR